MYRRRRPPAPPRRRAARSAGRLAGALAALIAATGGVWAQGAADPPKLTPMAISFGEEFAAQSDDGAARLGMVCAVTEYPLRSDPRFTLREPFLIAEIDADAEAFVFYGERETRRLQVTFDVDGARMRWSPQQMQRVRPATGELDLDAALDQPRTDEDARRWRTESTILFADEIRDADSMQVTFSNPYRSGRSVSFTFEGEGFSAWADAAYDLMRCCGLRGDGRSVSMSRLPKSCEREAAMTRRYLVDYESRRIVEPLD